MTITVTTPEGALDDRYAPLVFVATEPVVSVMVELTPEVGPRSREGVYDGTDADDLGGTFSELYAESTQVGNVWTIKRLGGWPDKCETELRIKPGRASTGPVTTWTTLYEKDLRTLPSAAILSGSSVVSDFTLDGQPWWAHLIVGSVDAVLGSGIRLIGGAPARPGSNVSGAFAGLRVSDMAGWDASKLTAVQVRYNHPVADHALVGLRLHGGGASLNSVQTGSFHIQVEPTAIHYWVTDFALNRSVALNLSPGYSGTIVPHDQYAFAIVAGPWIQPEADHARWRRWRCGYWTADLVDDGLPTMERMQPFGETNFTGAGENAALRVGAYAADTTDVGTVMRTRYLTHIRVLQKEA